MAALLLAGPLALTACGRDEKNSNTVQMKDLEVVDGTTTDAMTDLDGVQSEVPAATGPAVANNSSGPAPQEQPAANAAPSNTEVLSDQ